MALQTVRIGSATDIYQYDDAAFASGVEASAQMSAGLAPVNAIDVLRLADIPTPASVVTAAAVITDHAVLRGDGGARGIQDSSVTIDDAGNMIVPGNISTTEGNVTISSVNSAEPYLTIDNLNADANSGRIEFHKVSASEADDDEVLHIAGWGQNDVDIPTECFGFCQVLSSDVSDGAISGQWDFTVKVNNTDRNMLSLRGYNGAVGQAEIILNEEGVDCDIRIESVASVTSFVLLGAEGYIGVNVAVPLAQVHIDQSVNDATIPTLILDQADISEGFIGFIGSDRGIILGATDSLESVRVEVNGVVRRIAVYVDA